MTKLLIQQQLQLIHDDGTKLTLKCQIHWITMLNIFYSDKHNKHRIKELASFMWINSQYI